MNSSVSHPYLRLWLVESTTVCTLAYCYSSSLIYKCDGAHMVRLPCICSMVTLCDYLLGIATVHGLQHYRLV